MAPDFLLLMFAEELLLQLPASPPFPVTPRCEVHVCLRFCGDTEHCLEALLLVELELHACLGRASTIIDS